ncbi:MAG: PD40 domain-containing protein [Alphaproteobacteria bacterium]|nr:PD40 domain-containing protein [Alphaproteobacteria bacterium]MBP7758106.1 PD40 domain-containing protein [Alphaproteobacteria bacterium]MBP7761461.1 PD40 domain-containing protein [Alphaproteobacteria bacterium]MBP7903804.1 PD40 domain-containing protein [Alphaproteobacteria bacterium]
MCDRLNDYFCLIGILATLFIAGFGPRQDSPSPDAPEWSWYEGGVELYSPQFSPDGMSVVVVRKRHSYDGHEAESILDDEIKRHEARIDADPRYADPQVVILTPNGPIETVDWGWEPAFSPDGAKIAYSAQVLPISRYRVLASTLEGNEIRIYDRTANTSRTLAKPEAGYLTEPIFSPDGKQVAYSIGGAVNGAYGGNVGLGRVSIVSELNETLVPPTKTHGLFHLVNAKGFQSDRLLVIRCIPVKEGTFLSDEYRCDLLGADSLDTDIYSWGTRTLDDMNTFSFVPVAKDNLLVFDRGWRQVKQTSGTPSQTNLDYLSDPGAVSPNGLQTAHTSGSTVYIRDLVTGRLQRQFEVGGQIQELMWAPTSNRLAVIVTERLEPFSHDTLFVFSITQEK